MDFIISSIFELLGIIIYNFFNLFFIIIFEFLKFIPFWIYIILAVLFLGNYFYKFYLKHKSK